MVKIKGPRSAPLKAAHHVSRVDASFWVCEPQENNHSCFMVSEATKRTPRAFGGPVFAEIWMAGGVERTIAFNCALAPTHKDPARTTPPGLSSSGAFLDVRFREVGS